MSSYAYFLELVIKNADEAKRYHRRAEQLRARESDDMGLTDGSIESRAIITINEEGNIEQVNRAVTNLFGWLRLELITRNIKQLVPSPYRERHDMFLDRYKSSGNAKVIGFPPREYISLNLSLDCLVYIDLVMGFQFCYPFKKKERNLAREFSLEPLLPLP